MVSEKGRSLHAQALDSLEHKQDFEEALSLAEQALAAYQQDKDELGEAELYGARSNIHRHMGNLDKALDDAKQAVLKAESSGMPDAATLPYFDLGKTYLEMEDFPNAQVNLQRAFDLTLPERHNRPSVRADMKAQLAYAKYMAGDKSALEMVNQAISELEVSSERQYEKDVWLSGAHMRTAKMLKADNREQAVVYLEKARSIIDSNKELVLRRKQLEELQKSF
jgi:tetratricopeptide (TPR) repeat protein